MVNAKLTTAFVGLATLAAAAPVSQSSSGSPQEFVLSLEAEGYPVLTLNYLHIAAGQSQAAFERPSAYPGTASYLNNTYYNLDVGTDTDYSVYFAEVGDNYGVTTPVYASAGPNNGRDGFAIYNGTLTAKLDAALEHFFACNTTINQEPILGLFWGVYNSNGTAPYGCVSATLVQSFIENDASS